MKRRSFLAGIMSVPLIKFFFGTIQPDVTHGPNSIVYDGATEVWTGPPREKLYSHTGQFTSTLKTSGMVSGLTTKDWL